VLKKLYSLGALFSELLGSTVFIRPKAAGTRGAPEAALRWEVGAGAQETHASPGAALSREVGIRAAGTRGTPGAALHGPGAALSREDTRCPQSCGPRHVAPPELPRAGLLLAVSGDLFLVASYRLTKKSRVLKKMPLLLRSRHRHGFFFDFFRPCPSVAMSVALQWHQLS
jgi:hypothetical protein